jgi:hypothetical protein
VYERILAKESLFSNVVDKKSIKAVISGGLACWAGSLAGACWRLLAPAGGGWA